MEIELWLEMDEAVPGNEQAIWKRFRQWYAEGAEIRYDKAYFGKLSELEEANRFRVDLGQVDALTAIRDLHARLHRFGVKLFVHFLY
jgi:hypothetical protein